MKPAATSSSSAACPEHGGPLPLQALGQPEVFINGARAVRLADAVGCVPPDMLASGAVMVRVGGLPLAGVSHGSLHGAKIVTGSGDVNWGGPSFVLPACVEIRGTPAFKNKVVRDLYLLAETRTGSEIFERLTKAGTTVTIMEGASDLTVGNWVRHDPSEDAYVLEWRDDDQEARNITAPPQVRLGHELVHAVRIAEERTLPDEKKEEGRVRGDGLDFDEDSISENRLRDDLGLPRRWGEGVGRGPRFERFGPTNLRPGGY